MPLDPDVPLDPALPFVPFVPLPPEAPARFIDQAENGPEPFELFIETTSAPVPES